MKEYFLKGFLTKSLVLSAGFMDKSFGIKTPNHTAVNRSPIDLGQNSQVHGMLAHWIQKDADLFFHYWMGNAHLSQTDRASGGSFMMERKWGQMSAYGIGLLSEKSEVSSQNIIELHNKSGFGEGSALLSEIGYRIRKNTKNNLNEESKSYYIFTEGNLTLVKGYSVFSGIELAKNLTDTGAPDNLKWTLGLLAFPMQRFEFRFSGVNQKTTNTSEVVGDQWSIQSQIHVSL
jgi:hypothetical protein